MEASEKIRQHSNAKFKVNGAGKYIEVLPGTDDYKQFLQEALLCKDIDTLTRIKGNTTKPVHIIDGDNFHAYKKTIEGLGIDAIVVTRGLFRRWTKTEDGKYLDWQGEERPKPRDQGGWIEINAQFRKDG